MHVAALQRDRYPADTTDLTSVSLSLRSSGEDPVATDLGGAPPQSIMERQCVSCGPDPYCRSELTPPTAMTMGMPRPLPRASLVAQVAARALVMSLDAELCL